MKLIPTLSLFVIILSGLFFSCKNTDKPLVVLYDQEFDYVKDMAKKEGKTFCIILSRPDCPPCEHYVKYLGELYKDVSSKIIFNIVNVSQPENWWYLHWLCSGASPSTCIFSQKGELKAVVNGVKKNAVQCVKSSIKGNTACAEYFYDKHFYAKDYVLALNALLACKQNFDKGEDITQTVETCIGQSANPYALYLKSLNEEKQGRHDEAVYWAKLFQSNVSADPYQSRVYANVQRDIKLLINPNYTFAEDGVLSVIGELRIADCKFRQPQPFSITLTNTGKSPLFIHDIAMSCSCLKLQGERQLTLRPGEAKAMAFVFTADVQGEVFREITFFSDGTNAMETVRVTAKVE